jgi:hypothetical protein
MSTCRALDASFSLRRPPTNRASTYSFSSFVAYTCKAGFATFIAKPNIPLLAIPLIPPLKTLASRLRLPHNKKLPAIPANKDPPNHFIGCVLIDVFNLS